MSRIAPALLIVLLASPVLAAKPGPPEGDEIDSMKVRAAIRVESGDVTPETLACGSQEFEGAVRDGIVRGVFTVEARTFDGDGAPDALRGRRCPDEVKPHLRPDDGIDSGEEAISDRARSMVGLSSFLSTWRYATDFRGWVARNVEPGPRRAKASEVLAARTGDAHGRALLLAALCRSEAIPARLVSGVAVTDLSSGSAAPHTWVEVWMGAAGWVPLDPSAGGSERLTGGILRIAAGSVEVEALELEVLDFRPRAARRLPFDPGKTYEYDHLVDGECVRRCRFRVDEDGGGYRLSVETDLENGATRTSVLQTDRFLRPRRFGLRAEGKSRSTTETAAFRDGRASVTRAPAGGKRYSARFETGRDCYLVSADMAPCWAFILSQIPLDGGEVRVETCVTTSSQTMTVKLRPGEVGEIDLDGKKVEVREVGVLVGCKAMTFWVTPEGRLVQIEDGSRTVVLREGRPR